MTTLTIRKAGQPDLPAILELLTASKLPTDGVNQHLSNFLVAEMNGTIIGAIGLEVYQKSGLLRSAVVSQNLQNKGIGSRLYHMLVNYAKEQGVEELVLLTTTAEKYFSQKGFSRIDRDVVKENILSSTEFQGACPGTAVCMRKAL